MKATEVGSIYNYQDTAKALRKDIFLAAYSGGMAHLAPAFSCVDILYALYLNGVMRHDPKNPEWELRDRFVLSKGHGSLALYAVLCRAGYFSKELLMSFTKPESALGGEPSLCTSLGIEAATGSLGHGLSLGVGMALAQKSSRCDTRTFVLLGDGECQEGSVWEAVMTAAKYHLDNLVVIIDHNRLQKMDFVSTIMDTGDLGKRFEAFGWACAQADGHDIDSLAKAFADIKSEGRPHVLIAHTVKGKGVSIMEDAPAWHWRMPNKRELKVFMKELDISEGELAECR